MFPSTCEVRLTAEANSVTFFFVYLQFHILYKVDIAKEKSGKYRRRIKDLLISRRITKFLGFRLHRDKSSGERIG